jgi:hypothetical protein
VIRHQSQRFVFKAFSTGKTTIQPYALPGRYRFCIFGGLLFRHRNPDARSKQPDLHPAAG